MELVEPEDGSPLYREPPPPDDRLWRHPSEVGQLLGGGPPPGATPSRPYPVWLVAGLSALVASLVSSGLVVAVLGTRSHASSGAAVERQMVKPKAISTVPSSPVVEIADRIRPSIVQLSVQAGDHTGTGSGVVFRSDGYVLTNAHVVGDATAISVAMANGRQLPARLVGADPGTDTAVVKLDGGPFPVATLGTGDDLRVGQPAIAIGFPLGLAGGPSVTGGMISALHRQIRPLGSSTTLVDMIQTDAPVSPGSSGGALLDVNGAVVGITTAVASSDVGGGPLGFATTIDVARSVADELIRTGTVVHVWLGIEGGDLDGTTATTLDLDGGAMVAEVAAAGPADRAGIATRDVIVALAGKAVHSMGELAVALRDHAPGDTVAVEVVRDGHHRTLAVTLEDRPTTS
ncbi:MAG: S1C family serine protease [Acidimicrobiales bacterium]